MRFKQVGAGEWQQPRRKNYYMKCCDCGLTHRMNFRIVKDKRGRSFVTILDTRKGSKTYYGTNR